MTIVAIIWSLSFALVALMAFDTLLERRRERRFYERQRSRHPSSRGRLMPKHPHISCSQCGEFIGEDPERLKLVEHVTLRHSTPRGPEDSEWWSKHGRFQ